MFLSKTYLTYTCAYLPQLSSIQTMTMAHALEGFATSLAMVETLYSLFGMQL